MSRWTDKTKVKLRDWEDRGAAEQRRLCWLLNGLWREIDLTKIHFFIKLRISNHRDLHIGPVIAQHCSIVEHNSLLDWGFPLSNRAQGCQSLAAYLDIIKNNHILTLFSEDWCRKVESCSCNTSITTHSSAVFNCLSREEEHTVFGFVLLARCLLWLSGPPGHDLYLIQHICIFRARNTVFTLFSLQSVILNSWAEPKTYILRDALAAGGYTVSKIAPLQHGSWLIDGLLLSDSDLSKLRQSVQKQPEDRHSVCVHFDSSRVLIE